MCGIFLNEPLFLITDLLFLIWIHLAFDNHHRTQTPRVFWRRDSMIIFFSNCFQFYKPRNHLMMLLYTLLWGQRNMLTAYVHNNICILILSDRILNVLLELGAPNPILHQACRVQRWGTSHLNFPGGFSSHLEHSCSSYLC